MAQHFEIGEGFEEHLLVVASQHPHSALPGPIARARDYSGAVRAAINQIAQQHYSGCGGTGGGIVSFNRVNNRVEQIESSVNVANQVIAFASRYARHPSRRACWTKDLAKLRKHFGV